MNFVLIAQAPVDARLWPLVFARASASTLMAIIALFTRNLAAPTGTPLRLALFAGVLDTNRQRGHAAGSAVVAAVIGCGLDVVVSGATVALAMVVLKERVTRWQAVGIVLALLAVG